MVGIRRATLEDLIDMQQTNLMCLPENYQLKYYLYHGLSWPHVLHVAETDAGRIVGYVLAKMDEEDNKTEEAPLGGHITSISVHRDYRKLGIAKRLMEVCLMEMQEIYDAGYVSLNVRVSNVGALALYRDILGFKVIQEEVDYYADDENAFEMRKYFKPELEEKDILKEGKDKKNKGKKQQDEQTMGNLDDQPEATEGEEEKKEDPSESEATTDQESKLGESEQKATEDGNAETDKKKKKNRKKKRH